MGLLRRFGIFSISGFYLHYLYIIKLERQGYKILIFAGGKIRGPPLPKCGGKIRKFFCQILKITQKSLINSKQRFLIYCTNSEVCCVTLFNLSVYFDFLAFMTFLGHKQPSKKGQIFFAHNPLFRGPKMAAILDFSVKN